MRSGNPALGEKAFRSAGERSAEPMTLGGTVNKTFMLLALTIAASVWTWNLYFHSEASVVPWLAVGAIGGFIAALITIFAKKAAPVTAPLYALLEGLFLGGISAMFASAYSGIVIQAVSLTFAILFALLFLYKTRIIRATENFKLGVAAATFGIMLVYLFQFVLGFFGMQIPYLHSSGIVGIGISVFIVIVASLNLVLDFDFIENGVRYGAPKYMEWYGAFGLMVTLVWLYLETLRLIAKLRD
ncbi:MAG TPA: Bax inhibitor-1/YccA family protein [Bacillales bacterium]|nr:Bax inhibitor-1/YccA family protein [Bacillales bacterium]